VSISPTKLKKWQKEKIVDDRVLK